MTHKNKAYFFPFSLLVIFFASFIIIFSPVGKKNIIKITPTPTLTPTPTVTLTPTKFLKSKDVSH